MVSLIKSISEINHLVSECCVNIEDSISEHLLIVYGRVHITRCDWLITITNSITVMDINAMDNVGQMTSN